MKAKLKTLNSLINYFFIFTIFRVIDYNYFITEQLSENIRGLVQACQIYLALLGIHI